MTIRDLLTLNAGWFNDHIMIKKHEETILKLISIRDLHPIWLDYEVESYYMLPHKEGEIISLYSCDYIITMGGITIFQQKTDLDKELYKNFNERNKQHESTNND